MLTGSRHDIGLKLTDQESDVSLITGSTRLLTVSKEDEEIINKSLIKRDDALSMLHYSGAGDFFSK